MILEYWQGSGDLIHGISVIARAFSYVTALGIGGVALFLVFMSGSLTLEETASARKWLVVMLLLALVAEGLQFGLRAAVLSGVREGFFRLQLYPEIARSAFGDALWLRLAGMALALFALVPSTWGAGLATVGAVAIAASYAAFGHTTGFRPRQELAALVTIHVVAVSFWFGSLFPLRAITDRRDPRSAADSIDDWSRYALLFTGFGLISGFLLAWYLAGSWRALIGTWFGWALLAKVAVVAVLLLLAIGAKFRHTRLMSRGDALASAALRRSIGRQIIIAILVLYATAELVSVAPVSYGHQIPG